MNHSINRGLLAALAALSLGGTSACVDLKETPITGITSAYYGTPSGFDAAVSAMYTPLKTHLPLERGATMTVFGTDEFQKGADGSYKFFNDYTSSLDGSVDFIQNTWKDYFTGINTANTVIDAAKTAAVPAATAALRTAEAKFLRAYYYFTLVRTFGDVPLYIVPTAGVQTATVRDPSAKIYDLIIADLLAAEAALPDKAAQYGRADKPAAQYLLAEVYLTRASAGDMALSAAKAQLVVNNPRFKLLTKYSDKYDINNEVNTETIWAIQESNDPLSNGATNGYGNKLHLYFGYPYDLEAGMVRDIANDRPFKRFRPTAWLLGLWDRTKDSRYDQVFKIAWFSNNAATIPKDASGAPKFTFGDTSIFFPGRDYTAAEKAATRYKVYGPSDYGDAIFPVLNKFLDPTRTATNQEDGQRDLAAMTLDNMYLMLAEALMRDGKPDQGVPYINALRTRVTKAGQNMQITTADMTLDFILDERARELTGEFTRWFDLTRTHKLVERVTKFNPGGAPNVKACHELRPIPLTEINLSTGGIKQNPCY